jgi:hypothetical protein
MREGGDPALFARADRIFRLRHGSGGRANAGSATAIRPQAETRGTLHLIDWQSRSE